MSDNEYPLPLPLRFFRIITLRDFSRQAIDSQWLTGIFFYCNTYKRSYRLRTQLLGSEAKTQQWEQIFKGSLHHALGRVRTRILPGQPRRPKLQDSQELRFVKITKVHAG